jgi:hypothetical protein
MRSVGIARADTHTNKEVYHSVARELLAMADPHPNVCSCVFVCFMCVYIHM